MSDVMEQGASYEEKCDTLIAIMQQLMSDYMELKGQFAELQKVVYDEIIGGVTDLYNKNQRTMGIGDIQSKYKDLFSPYEDGLKTINPEFDLYGRLFDELDGLKKQPDFSDEIGDARIKEIAEELGGKFASLTGKPATVEATKVEATPEPTDEEQLINRIKKIKSAQKKSGASMY